METLKILRRVPVFMETVKTFSWISVVLMDFRKNILLLGAFFKKGNGNAIWTLFEVARVVNLKLVFTD